MCLYLTNIRKTRIAKEDIICYKILIKERKRWISRIFHKPTYRAPFYINHTYRLKELNDLGRSLTVDISTINAYPAVVYEGYHSFVDIQDAKRILKDWYETPGGQTIVQCVIPKGAEYAKGTIDKSSTSPASYVSNQIICVKEV